MALTEWLGRAINSIGRKKNFGVPTRVKPAKVVRNEIWRGFARTTFMSKNPQKDADQPTSAVCHARPWQTTLRG